MAKSMKTRSGTTNLTNRLVLDSIDFGIQESEEGHRGFGDLSLTEGPVQNLFKGENYVRGEYHEINHWRDVGGLIGFELLVPVGMPVRNLKVELSCKRYVVGMTEPMKAVPVYLATVMKVFPLGRIKLDQDEKWFFFRFDLSGILPEILDDEKLVFFIDNRLNAPSSDHHYGISLSSASLHCADSLEIKAVPPDHQLEKSDAIDAEIVLAMCPVWDFTMPPISIACIASNFRANGVEPHILDFNIDSFTAARPTERELWLPAMISSWVNPTFVDGVIKRYTATIDRVVERIVDSPARMVAFSIYASNLSLTLEVAKRIKDHAPQIIVVYGGPGIVFTSREKLGEAWDYLIVGEGEGALFEIFTGRISSNNGIIERTNWSGIDIRNNRHYEKNLNELPLLSFRGIDLTLYQDLHSMPAYTSRGCLRGCAYCFDSIFYSPYRRLDGGRAFEHLSNLYYSHGRTYFELSDLLLNGDLLSVETMARMISEAKLPIKWGGFAIIRKDMRPDFFKALQKGGCDYMRYGFETACDTHLKAMRRGYSPDVAKAVLTATKKAGVKTYINLLVGFPGETDATVEETIDFLKLNHRYIDRVETVNTIAMMPEIDLRRKAANFGIDIDDSKETWKTNDHDIIRRLNWAKRIHEVIMDLGITLKTNVHSGG